MLAYDLGKHSISREAQVAALDQARRLARRVEVVALKGLPQCRDPEDQKFIELAAASQADALVTKDRELLRMKRRLPFRVIPPGEFLSATSPAAL